MDIKGMGRGSVDWIHLAQEMVQCWVIVVTTMKLLVSSEVGDFLVQLSDYGILQRDSPS
jgi:hypothetical protein